jgi:hypothetical protein
VRLNLRQFKIEKASQTRGGGSRPRIAQPYLDVDAQVLVATDSYVMAIVPVEIDENDVSGAVPTAALAEARKRTKGKGAHSEIRLNGRAEIADGEVSFRRPEIEKFISWQEIADNKPGEPIVVFGLNPFRLAQVAEAMGCGKQEALTIEIYAPRKPIHVSHGNGARGIVMPVVVSGERP